MSTLTVVVTGAGKASVMWNVILGQAPNIHSGLVELHGADLKGSMELSTGAALFTRLARTSAEAAIMSMSNPVTDTRVPRDSRQRVELYPFSEAELGAHRAGGSPQSAPVRCSVG